MYNNRPKILPTEEFKEKFISYQIDDKYLCPKKEFYWMMFFNVKEINEKWMYFMNLFENNLLDGIYKISVSTMHIEINSEGVEVHKKDDKVINFFFRHLYDPKDVFTICWDEFGVEYKKPTIGVLKAREVSEKLSRFVIKTYKPYIMYCKYKTERKVDHISILNYSAVKYAEYSIKREEKKKEEIKYIM